MLGRNEMKTNKQINKQTNIKNQIEMVFKNECKIF